MYEKIVILTGAGISAESGLATFRGKGGLWQGRRAQELATPEAFATEPQLVQDFYNMRRNQLLKEAKPNLAHQSLADFEQQHRARGGSFILVTQNVDDLHERAGSKNIIHMHGELLKARDTKTGEVTDCTSDLTGSRLRPHIVWFGEMPMFMDEIQHHLLQCDLFVAIGTSGHVYPAAGFVQIARQAGAHTVELNLDESLVASDFAEIQLGHATELVPQYFSSLLDFQAESPGLPYKRKRA